MPSFNLPVSNSDLLDSIRKQLRGQTRIYKSLQIITGGFFPLVEAFLVNQVSSGHFPAWLWVILILIALVHLFFLVLIVATEKPLTQFLIEFDSQVEELTLSQKELYFTELFYISFREALVSANFSLVTLENILNQPIQDWSEILSQILSPWVNSRTDIFWFQTGDALYNIAVYLWDEEDELLKIAFRQCDDRMKRRDRQWEKGVGHVGICFSRRETQYCNDLTQIPSTTNQQSSRTEDAVYYKSVIAEPIKIEQNVIGVFIITSSQEEQFDENIHVPCVRIISQLLGLAYQLIHSGGQPNENSSH